MFCYDIADMSIAGALESSPGKKTDPDALCRLRKDCEALDCLASDNDCESFSADVDGDALVLSMTCPGYEFREGCGSPFFDVIGHCDSFCFHNDGDAAVLTLRYGGIIR